jgi:hypothetical protein
MSIYPAWRRDNNKIGEKIDPIWFVSDGTVWDPYRLSTSILIKGDIGDYPYEGFYTRIANHGSLNGTIWGYVSYEDTNESFRPSIDTANPKIGTGSLSFPPGSNYNQYISFTSNFYNAVDYTFESWFYMPIALKPSFRFYEFGSSGTDSRSVAFCLSNTELGGSTTHNIRFSTLPPSTNISNNFNLLTATSSIAANTWNHVVWQSIRRSSSDYVFRIYINGILDAELIKIDLYEYFLTGGGVMFYNSSTSSGFNGRIDELRETRNIARYKTDKFLVQKIAYGTVVDSVPTTFDPYYQFNKLLLPMTGINNSTIFTDKSGWNNAVTGYSGAVISTTEQKFSDGSLALTAAGSRLEIDQTSATNSGLSIINDPGDPNRSIDFTIESWIYISSSGYGPAIAITDTTARAFVLKNGSTVKTLIGEYDKSPSVTYLETGYTSIPANEWAHIAWSSTSGVLRTYINGISIESRTNGMSNSALLRIIGAQHHGGGLDNHFDGYIDDLRVTIGAGRYTGSNFALPMVQHMNYPA